MNARTDYDIAVAGGGPVGLAAAIHARRAGLSAVVLEPRRGPIDKACGEGLMPEAVDALLGLGVEPDPSRPFSGIRYVQGGRAVRADFPGGARGLGVRRTSLHEALLERAVLDGVAFEHRTVREIEQDPDGVRVEGIRAGHLLVADGVRSSIRRRLGVEVKGRRQRFGIRRHLVASPWSHDVEVHWADGAEAYVTPVADDLVGVAILCQGPPLAFGTMLERFPTLRDHVEGGEWAGPARAAGPFDVYARRVALGRVLLVGDAAGFLDPITGEGVRLGLASAEASIRAITAGSPAAYPRAWRRLVRRYWWLTSGLLALTARPFLRRRLVAILERAPWLFSSGLGLLAGRGMGAAKIGETLAGPVPV